MTQESNQERVPTLVQRCSSLLSFLTSPLSVLSTRQDSHHRSKSPPSDLYSRQYSDLCHPSTNPPLFDHYLFPFLHRQPNSRPDSSCIPIFGHHCFLLLVSCVDRRIERPQRLPKARTNLWRGTHQQNHSLKRKDDSKIQ